MLSIWIGITTNIGKASTKIVDMSSFLTLLRQAAARGSMAINIKFRAPSPMLAPPSTNSLTTKRRRREIFSMQTFHFLLTMVLTLMIQTSDIQSLEH